MATEPSTQGTGARLWLKPSRSCQQRRKAMLLCALTPWKDACIILSPTRELASKALRVMQAVGNNMSMDVHACVCGKSIGEEIRKLESGVRVVSGSLGRDCDMIMRRTLRTRAIKLLVLDEADEMLSKGFKDQI